MARRRIASSLFAARGARRPWHRLRRPSRWPCGGRPACFDFSLLLLLCARLSTCWRRFASATSRAARRRHAGLHDCSRYLAKRRPAAHGYYRVIVIARRLAIARSHSPATAIATNQRASPTARHWFIGRVGDDLYVQMTGGFAPCRGLVAATHCLCLALHQRAGWHVAASWCDGHLVWKRLRNADASATPAYRLPMPLITPPCTRCALAWSMPTEEYKSSGPLRMPLLMK